jgi:hypothetical protein
VNEYTTNNGVQIQGRKSGASIASGYVGELNQLQSGSYSINNTQSSWRVASSVSLTTGIYLVSFGGRFGLDGMTWTTLIDLNVAISGSSAAPTVTNGYDGSSSGSSISLNPTYYRVSLSTAPVYVRVTSSNIIVGTTSFSGSTLYFQLYTNQPSTGTGTFLWAYQVIRIA